jgi:hypothetical protein
METPLVQASRMHGSSSTIWENLSQSAKALDELNNRQADLNPSQPNIIAETVQSKGGFEIG